MKKNYFLFISVLTLGFFFSSCSSSDEHLNNPTTESGKLQFEFDGKTFISTSVQAIVSDQFISITAVNQTNKDFIQIAVPSNKVGTYTWENLGNAKENLGLAYSPSSNEYSAFISLSPEDTDEIDVSNYTDTASITITSIDLKTKKISGTFQFTGIRNTLNNKPEIKSFTNGFFKDITFTNDNPVKNDSTLSAKLDGTDFTPTYVYATSSMNKITIGGTRGSVENIGISIPDSIEPGTYTVGDSELDYIIRYGKDITPEGIFDATTGTITILTHNTTKKTISGTFTASFISFFSTEKHTATEGTFNVSY